MTRSNGVGSSKPQQPESSKLQGMPRDETSFVRAWSGGTHEIDVLAEKSGGLTTFSVLVECTAWNVAINKDVIAKAAYARDLGTSEAIVVSLEGATVEAQHACTELGVEMWGPDELESHLGRAGLAGLRPMDAWPSSTTLRSDSRRGRWRRGAAMPAVSKPRPDANCSRSKVEWRSSGNAAVSCSS
jgi:hypothetical protein